MLIKNIKMETIFTMKVKNPYYEELFKGVNKPFEGRSYKWNHLKVGDFLLILNDSDHNDSFKAEIIKINYYPYNKLDDNDPLMDYLLTEGHEKATPGLNLEDSYKLYIKYNQTLENIKNYGGFMAIYIKRKN